MLAPYMYMLPCMGTHNLASLTKIFISFLALLEYHQSSWNQNLSVFCPCMMSVRVEIIPESMRQISFNFQLLTVWTIHPDFFEFYKRKWHCFLMFHLFFLSVSMGPYESKNVETLLRPQITFKSSFSWIFFSMDLIKGPFWIFKILSFWFLRTFIRKFQVRHCNISETANYLKIKKRSHRRKKWR